MSAFFGITDLHLHLEGSLFPKRAIDLARGTEHPWANETLPSLRRRFSYSSFDHFLQTIREMCSLLCSVTSLRTAASELSLFLARHGVLYAEVYVSPFIYMRTGMTYQEVIEAVTTGLDEAESSGGAKCALLLDSVRHWGPEAAEAVLDGAAAHPHERVIGFGLGGSETPPLEQFVQVFARAASLGLRRVVHAGETGSGDDVWKAIELLGVERIAHGIKALESPRALRTLRDREIPLDLAVTSNYRTRVATGEHPIRRLLDAGVTLTLNTDDPSLFRTDPIREYHRARRFGRVSAQELYTIAHNGIEASFASEELKAQLRRELSLRRSTFG